MTTPRTHSRAAYLRIKAATRDLVDLCGGLERAARHTRVSNTKLCNAGTTSSEHATVFLAADVVADLERAAGDPLVTRELAHVAGFELFRLPVPGEGENWVSLLGLISQEAAAVIGKLAGALKDDGVVSATEVRQLKIVDVCDEAIAAIVRLRVASMQSLEAVEAKGERK